MADTIKISGLPEKTTIAETDFLVGNVGTGTDATGRVEIDALRTRLNIANQTIVGDITHTGDQETSGNIKASTLEGNGALITGVVAAGTGGTSSTGSLSLVCNSANGTPAAKIVGSKFSQDLWEADENGFKVRTGIPYTHEDASIPFDKDINQQGNHLLQSQTIQDIQPAQYAHYNGAAYSMTPDNADLDFGTNDFSMIGRLKTGSDFSGGEVFVLTKRTGTGNGYFITINTSNKLRFGVDAGSVVDVVSDSVINDGEWHRFAMLGDRDGNLSMYIDGVIQADTAAFSATDISNSSDLYIGSNDGGATLFFIGDQSDIFFFNRLLTAEEAKALSSNPNKALDWADEGGSNVAQNVSTCVNSGSFPYDLFASATATGFDYQKTTTGAGAQIAGSADEIVVKKGKKYVVGFQNALASGVAPSVNLLTDFGATGVTVEGPQVSTNGANVLVFTASQDATARAQFSSASGNLSSGSITLLDVHQLGCTLRYKGAGMTTGYLADSSGNGNDATNTDVSIGNPAIFGEIDCRYVMKVPRLTTTQKNALTAVNGMVVYDTTLNKFQGFENGTFTSFI